MFELNQMQKMVEKAVREFTIKEIQPRVEALEALEELPYPLMKRMMAEILAADWIRERIAARADKLEKNEPAEAGGDPEKDEMQGMDPMIQSLVLKELSRVSPGFCMSWGVCVGLCGNTIAERGTPDQMRRYAIPTMTCEKVGAWALTEPEAGSDAFGAMNTTARKENGSYVLNGAKTFITNGPHADIFLLYTRLDTGDGDHGPVQPFILERGMKGLSTGEPFKKMGMKDSPTGEVFLDEVRVGPENILGGREKEGGRDQVRESLGGERSGVVPMCLGIVERCYDLSVKYARKRRQFGRPIAEFQAVQMKIAEMYILLQNLWNMTCRLAWLQKEGKRDMAFACSSKVYAARAAVDASLDAIQIHGGYGYMTEYHIEKLMRDAKLLEIGAGTTDINLLTTARLELGL